MSCQDLRSTLREGNRTCPGEEVIFTCTIRGPSNLQTIAVAWSSTEYIGQGESLQLSTANRLGDTETITDMDGSITATATVTNNIDVNGELILETTLRITAVVASTVTCTDPNGGPASIEFVISGTYTCTYSVIRTLVHAHCTTISMYNTVNHEYLDVKIFLDSMAYAKIKRTKYMHAQY